MLVVPSRPHTVAYEIETAKHEGYRLHHVTKDEHVYGVSNPKITTGHYLHHHGSQPVTSAYQDEENYNIQYQDTYYNENITLHFKKP